MNIAAGADIKEMINRPFHETFGGRFLEVRETLLSAHMIYFPRLII